MSPSVRMASLGQGFGRFAFQTFHIVPGDQHPGYPWFVRTTCVRRHGMLLQSTFMKNLSSHAPAVKGQVSGLRSCVILCLRFLFYRILKLASSCVIVSLGYSFPQQIQSLQAALSEALRLAFRPVEALSKGSVFLLDCTQKTLSLTEAALDKVSAFCLLPRFSHKLSRLWPFHVEA